DSGGGIVLPPEEPELLARAILELKKDPARCREMGKQGREFVSLHYAWSSIVARWLGELDL
ncbi:MAG TPA: glycosyltransferase WbuB, partial [Desulfosporosinus sp.]|nr:glycosyltransferase WbuB [Desulfosporosinus sp.]